VTINDDIRRFIATTGSHQVAERDLTDERDLIGEEVLDSLGIYALVSFLEEHFGIEVEDDELVYENFATIGDISRMVGSKLP
jgi:acyl carrier protein